jgi:methionine sulfoxide reductase heme-binding subunit
VPAAAIAAGVAPALWLAGRGVLGGLGADPVAEILNQLGLFALISLLASLACTPLNVVTGWKWPLRVRRILGLTAFFYGCFHLATYAVLDQSLDPRAIVEDVLKRRFITLGMLTFALLLPLALTSTQRWIQRLGFRRWKRLHRLAYVAGVTAVIHYFWRFKLTEPGPIAAAAVLGLLFAVRLGHWLRTRRPAVRTAPESRPLL